MEEPCARVGGCSPASLAFDWSASRRTRIWLTDQPENARSNGTALHRQSRCASRDVRRRLHHSQTAGGAHFRSCPAAAGKLGEVAREIFTQSATERRNAVVGDAVGVRGKQTASPTKKGVASL